jgi:hypothetical protein
MEWSEKVINEKVLAHIGEKRMLLNNILLVTNEEILEHIGE